MPRVVGWHRPTTAHPPRTFIHEEQENMPRSLLMLALATASFPTLPFRRCSALFDIRHPLPAQRSDQLVVAEGAGMVGSMGSRRVGCVRRKNGYISRGQIVPLVVVIGEVPAGTE